MRDILIKFIDGPLAGRGNLPDATGAIHTFTFPEDTYGWPLPDQLCVLAHLDHVENVAIWNPDDESFREDALPVEIRESPNLVTYHKIAESQLTDEQIAGYDRVVRGAQYKSNPRCHRCDEGIEMTADVGVVPIWKCSHCGHVFPRAVLK